MSAPGENINPRILVWARETAGLSLAEAAHRLKLSADNDASAAKLAEMEAGTRLPTRSQLAKFTALYRRPLVAFYMGAPPPRGERGEDFRAGQGMVSPRQNALLDALLRDIRARQSMVRSVLEDEDEAAPLAFVGSASMREGVSSMAVEVTKALGLSISAKGRPGGADALFQQLRAHAEQMGVFVLLVGDLGSYHSAIGEEVFRGFAIADPIAPFIVINDQDAKIARAFTLVHELTHIYLGQSGVSGTPDEASESTPKGRIEQACNDVAGEVLLPSSGLATVPAGLDREGKEAAARAIQSIALTWSVSEPMVAYRLHRLGRISGATHRALHADYAARWRELRVKEKARDKQKEGGPSYYVVKQHRLGDGLMEVVRRTLRDNLLSHTKAAKVLGVKSSSVEPLIHQFEMGRGAFAPEMGRQFLLYLLDANVLIRAHEDYYALDRVPQFWSWLLDVAAAGDVKMAYEIYSEIAISRGPLKEWICEPTVKQRLVLDEADDPALLNRVVAVGYAPDLSDSDVEKLGRDPFLAAYGWVSSSRAVVTKEVSKPDKKRANRKVPDVSKALDVKWATDLDMYRALGFSTAGK